MVDAGFLSPTLVSGCNGWITSSEHSNILFLKDLLAGDRIGSSKLMCCSFNTRKFARYVSFVGFGPDGNLDCIPVEKWSVVDNEYEAR